MKNLIFIILITLSPTPLHAEALITGVVKNASAGEKLELIVPHYYIDGGTDSYSGVLDGQLQFSIRAIVPEPQVVFLRLGDDQLAVFLEPTDTLMLKTDLFQFPLGVSFGGRAGANNRLMRDYFQQYRKLDFNEFNNIRFKVGQWWFGVESTVNETMLNLGIESFKAETDKRRADAGILLEAFQQQNPGALTPAFQEWIEAEILYEWALHLLLFGQVYKNRYQVPDTFFDFLYEASVASNAIGSDAYRQFLLVLMARQQARKDEPERFFIGQYEQGKQLLSGKTLAWFQSEIIRMAMSNDRMREILPVYTQFLQTNTYTAFDAKVTTLYEKSIRVAAGSPAPDIAATDADGQQVSLKSMRGSVVYVNFWATWCSACIKKMDVFNTYEPELEAAGVKIINISLDDNAESWRTMLVEHKFIGKQILSNGLSGQSLTSIYNVEAVPQYFIINKDGTFADKPYVHQPDDIRRKLIQLAQ